jgi:lysylphosphatidylglycerol synthetase-like protein (DUF2156 family)
MRRHPTAAPFDEGLVSLVRRFGGVLSPVVFDPGCELFSVPGVTGAVPLRRSLGGVVVAIGDPICAPETSERLVAALRDRFTNVLFAGASQAVATLAHRIGFAVIEFGEQITIDPRRDRPRGRRGHELTRKLNHARAEEVTLHEYVAPGDRRLEQQMARVAHAWLDARRGLQVFVAHIDLFQPRSLRRWFYATWRGRVIGVQSLVRLDARAGYLLEHLVTVPDAPVGTAEYLVAGALDTIGRERCTFASFGVSTAAALGYVSGLSPASIWLGRWFFNTAQRGFHLDSVSRFRKKFGEVVVEPSYLMFSPPRVGPLQLLGLMHAFNASLAL